MSGETQLSQLQLQFIIQSLQQNITQAVNSQTQTISQTIHAQLNSEEYYSRLIELVEKITTVNTQMVQNQKDLKILIEEQVLPAFDCVKCDNQDIIKKTCDDVQLFLYGEKYKVMEMAGDLYESGIVGWIKRIVIFVTVFAAIIGALEIGPKIYSMIRSVVQQGG